MPLAAGFRSGSPRHDVERGAHGPSPRLRGFESPADAWGPSRKFHVGCECRRPCHANPCPCGVGDLRACPVSRAPMVVVRPLSTRAPKIRPPPPTGTAPLPLVPRPPPLCGSPPCGPAPSPPEIYLMFFRGDYRLDATEPVRPRASATFWMPRWAERRICRGAWPRDRRVSCAGNGGLRNKK